MDSPESVPLPVGKPDERVRQHYFDIVHETSPLDQLLQAVLDNRVHVQPERPEVLPATEWPEARHVAYRVIVDPPDG